ncbi:gene transfer agent family protein [Brevundimonas sp.]|uniref:gene transfer agent family protein n=1 Tax=Brevundimonas sp. TaxID=1871086 RepID=UPI0035AF80DC
MEPGRTASIRAYIGNDVYDLKLGLGEIMEFEDRTGVGCMFAMVALADNTHTWKSSYISEALRLGLKGAHPNSNPVEWTKLIDTYVGGEGGFLLDYKEVAAQLLYAAVGGPKDEPIEAEEDSGEPVPKA